MEGKEFVEKTSDAVTPHAEAASGGGGVEGEVNPQSPGAQGKEDNEIHAVTEDTWAVDEAEKGTATPGPPAAYSPSQSTHALTLSQDENFYPEGGTRAWLVVFGSWCGSFASLGIMNTLSSFHAYISNNQLAGYSAGDIGWIFSVYSALSFGLGVFVGPIFDKFGARALIATGASGIVAAMMILSICTEYWHFMLDFGVLCGVSTCLIFSPTISAIGHWFKLRRGFAVGVGTTGGAIGGIFFPLMMQYLVPQVGWAWTVRIIGFVCLSTLITSSILVTTRLKSDGNSGAKPDFTILRTPTFALTVAAVYLTEWALLVPLTYVSSYALQQGFKEDFSYQCIMILNVGSAFGRLLPGFYADIIGAFNTMILTTMLCVITTLCIWLPAGHTMPGIIIFCLLFGFASGSNISLTPVCVGKLCRTENLGKYHATCYTIVSIGCLTGIPIVGEIIKANDGEYWGLITFTGMCYVGAVVFYSIVRVLKVGWTWNAYF